MPIRKDYAGDKFGYLTILQDGGRLIGHQRSVICLCDCGITKTIRLNHILDNKIKSCGCLVKKTNTTHGYYYHSSYRTWVNMVDRCTNAASKKYKDYGGRGIKVCNEWLNIENFIRDMGIRPSSKHTIERKNNNDGYNKENCSWELMIVQSNNTRRTRRIEWNNKIQSVSQWSRELNISREQVLKIMVA